MILCYYNYDPRHTDDKKLRLAINQSFLQSNGTSLIKLDISCYISPDCLGDSIQRFEVLPCCCLPCFLCSPSCSSWPFSLPPYPVLGIFFSSGLSPFMIWLMWSSPSSASSLQSYPMFFAVSILLFSFFWIQGSFLLLLSLSGGIFWVHVPLVLNKDLKVVS